MRGGSAGSDRFDSCSLPPITRPFTQRGLLPAYVIGTAGHVDHGKTFLVRALTGVDTDRLPEEKRRGISIELGFAPWRVADDVDATVIDVPGHRRLVHTMIAGASGIELVLIVIAADEGVMPQTREHARVCEELGIHDAIVVLTKTDRVDAETVALAEEEARALVDGRFAFDVHACSAATGVGMEELRDLVARRLRSLARGRTAGPARLWVDRVLKVTGAGTVVTGTLVSGRVTKGDDLVLLGPRAKRRVTVRGLRVHEETRGLVEAPSRLALNLSIAAEDVRRGDLLTGDVALEATTVLEVSFRGTGPRRGSVLSLHVGATHVAARVTRTEPLGDREALLRLLLREPAPLAGGDPVLLRGPGGEDGSLVGGATVLDAWPHPRSRGESRRVLLRAVRGGDVETVLTSALAEVSPRPVELSTLQRRFAVDVSSLGRCATARVGGGTLVALGAAADSFLARKTLVSLSELARGLVHDHARAHPLDRGFPLATLLEKLSTRAGPLAADAAVLAARARRSARDDQAIVVLGDVVVPSRSDARPDAAVARLLDEASVEIERAGPRGASAARLREGLSTTPDQTAALLAALERAGSAVRAGELWFAPRVIADLRALVVAHLAAKGRVTVVDLKALAGLPRNQAVLLLEHFDRVNVTRRVGDFRVLSRPD